MRNTGLDTEARRRLDRVLAAPRAARVGVLGLGVVGRAMALHLARRGAAVVAVDQREDLSLVELTRAGVEIRLGQTGVDGFGEIEALAITPGADPRQAAVKALVAAGVPVFGELELAGLLPAKRVISITGTNGKSTTTELVGALVKATGRTAFVGGNLGDSIIAWVDRREPVDVAVLELSSFQLETAYRFRTDVAMVLNLTPDHFERYESVAAYATTKRRLVECVDADGVTILNRADPQTVAMSSAAAGSVWWFSSQPGAELEDGVSIRGDRAIGWGSATDLTGFDLAHARLFGNHNRENAMAALLAVRAINLLAPDTREKLVEAYQGFEGLEHRLEWVADRDGLRFVNDSKATNDDAAAIAVSALDRPILLLAGGRDKGTGYGRLVAAASGRVRVVFAYGEAGGVIERSFQGKVLVIRLAGMREAFAAAVAQARPGDVVLLAPACSSFDEFENYKQRGREFKRLVAQWSGGVG